jgi:hypothetical protein
VDGLLEFSPKTSGGALHIRVLDRSRRGEVRKGEAAELVRRFAENQGAAVEPQSVNSATGTDTARAAFTSTHDGTPLQWDVLAQVWDEHGLLGSYVHDGKHEQEREEALEILSSIEPGSADEASV